MLNTEKYKIDFDDKRNIFEIFLIKNNIEVCKCKMYTNPSKTTWTISSWYTLSDFNHQGFGKKTLEKTVWEMYKQFGIPEKIEYIWNGTNEYVYAWLSKNFDAISNCPIAVQKYANDDDWQSHIYTLNKNKFLNYFGIKEEKILKKTYPELER